MAQVEDRLWRLQEKLEEIKSHKQRTWKKIK